MPKIDHGRRRLLELAGGGTVAALAGCLSGGEAADETIGTTAEADTETMTHDKHDDTTTESDGSTEAKMQTVFHFSGSPDQQKHALANVTNLIEDESIDLDDVVLVANGAGIQLVLSEQSKVPEKLDTLIVKGVTFKACRNSLDGRDLSESDLLDGVEVVPAGVGELTRRQCQGYAYIKTP